MGRADWQNSATEPILRLLTDSGLALSARSIVYNLNQQLERPPSRATVHRALSGAMDVGLVHQPSGSLYAITDTGREYVSGDLSVDDVEVSDRSSQ